MGAAAKYEASSGVQHNSNSNSWRSIDDGDESDSTMSFSSHGSIDSGESSSFDVVDDASSAFSSSETLDSSPRPNKGPLYELSDLMAQLPIKRGLSIHFQGKSQSFTSLSEVRSIEDLAKKENPCGRRKMKSCKSYAGLDGNHTSKSLTPKACSRTISKRVSRGSPLVSCKTSSSNSPRSPFSLQDEF